MLSLRTQLSVFQAGMFLQCKIMHDYVVMMCKIMHVTMMRKIMYDHVVVNKHSVQTG